MNEIQELLKKQHLAMEVKKQLLETAKKLQLSAEEMIKQANAAPVVSELKLAREQKRNRIDKFNSNVATLTLKDMDNQLAANGWTILSVGADSAPHRTYHNKAYPGYWAQFKNNKLSITFHGENKVKGLYWKDGKTMQYLNPSQFCKTSEK